MKKIYALGFGVLAAFSLSAQVTVTFKVDVTDYLAGGETLNANGIRIGGNFANYGATAGGNAMVDWSPSDANSAMTDEGNNIWSIAVEYPASSIGDTQQFKFVNGDWGTNEGTATSLIATDGCGIDDGSGNINRTMEIPAEGITLEYCWEACTKCDGSDALTGLSELSNIADFSVMPNPATSNTIFTFTTKSSEKVSLKLYSLLGAEVATVVNGNLAAGTYNQEIALDNLSNGVYMYVLRAGDSVTQGKIVKQ